MSPLRESLFIDKNKRNGLRLRIFMCIAVSCYIQDKGITDGKSVVRYIAYTDPD